MDTPPGKPKRGKSKRKQKRAPMYLWVISGIVIALSMVGVSVASLVNVIEMPAFFTDQLADAEAAMFAGRYLDAIDLYTQQIERGNNVAAYAGRADAYYRIGDYTAAIADYTHVIEHDPNNHAAYYERGVAHEAAGEIKPAFADITQAIQLANNPPPRYYRKLGSLHEQSGSTTQALEQYELYLETIGENNADPDFLAHIEELRTAAQ